MAVEQLDLGAYARRPDPETAKEAADQVAPAVASVNTRILWALRGAGERGLTTKELHAITGISRVTISPRMKPLEEEAGLVARTNERRDGCYVYVATSGEKA